jgi:hypothetical protein
MGERNFKQIGKYQFSFDIPIDSDLLLAIKLAIEKRDRTFDDLATWIKTGGVLKEDREKILFKIDVILEQNESIKLMEDALVAVRAYKLDLKNNEENKK